MSLLVAGPGAIVIAGLLTLLLLGSAACRGSEPATVAPATATPHPTTAPVFPLQAMLTGMPTLPPQISPTTIPTLSPQASPTAMPTPNATPLPKLTPTATALPTATSPSQTISPSETEDGVAVPADGSWTRLALEVLSTSEIDCLKDELDPLDIDTFGDGPRSGRVIFDTPWETWSSCIRPERTADISVAYLETMVGGFSSEPERCIWDTARDFQVQSAPPISIPFILVSASFADTCLSEDEYMKYEVGYFSFEAGGLNSEERDCVRELHLPRGELAEVTLTANYGRLFAWLWHPAFHCLSYDKIVELKVDHLAMNFGYINLLATGVFGNLQDYQLDCVRALFAQTESIGQSVDTFDEGTMAGELFMGAATVGCFTTEEIMAFYNMDPAQSDTTAIDCTRQLYSEKFPILLQKEMGEKMFRNPDELSPQELEFVQSFFAGLEGCEDGS